MKIAIPVAPVGSAFLAVVAAFMLQALPAAAQPICGDTAVEVRFHVREHRHALGVGRLTWSNCTRGIYGDQWSNAALARPREEPYRLDCYRAGAVRSYYHNRGIRTCTGDLSARRWVCYYRATPCRYDGRRDREDDDD